MMNKIWGVICRIVTGAIFVAFIFLIFGMLLKIGDLEEQQLLLIIAVENEIENRKKLEEDLVGVFKELSGFADRVEKEFKSSADRVEEGFKRSADYDRDQRERIWDDVLNLYYQGKLR